MKVKQLEIQQSELLVNYKDVLTFNELKELLNVGRTKTYQLLQDGTIKSMKVGTQYRIPKVCVINYLYSNL